MSDKKQQILTALTSFSSAALREISDSCEKLIEERVNDGVFD